MSSEESEETRGFKVVDRRSDEEPASQEQAAPQQQGAPQVDFATFVLSLGTSALYHLGFVGDPETGKPAEEKNLPLARQTIDALEMLERKTHGNLEDEEGRLLESLLYELHMRFVEASKADE